MEYLHPPKKFATGEKFLYRGRSYPLLVKESKELPPGASFIGSRIVAYVPSNTPQAQRDLLVKESLKSWYKSQAQKLLPEQVDYYAKLLNISYNKLRVKDQKTRWGSCSNKGNINLNWRIIMAPNQVTAYVIIHELTHLIFLNHSKDFWKTVEQYLPDYKKWRKWLAKNGRDLFF